MGLARDLGSGDVGVDTSIFIYFIESHPKFLPLIRPLFAQVDEGKRGIVTSAVTLLEVLAVPYRAGNHALAQKYESVLTRARGVQIVDLSKPQLRAAAQLRAATGAKIPDALQLVAALSAGCKTFVTTDRRLPSIPGLRVIDLAAYAS